MVSRKIIVRSACFVVVLFILLQIQLFLPKLAYATLNQLPVEVERRLLWWNWQDTPAEIACQTPPPTGDDAAAKAPIPNVVHFIFLAPDGHDTELTQWDFVAIKAALVRIQPDALKIHAYRLNQQNPYWRQLQHRVTPVLHDRQRVLGAVKQQQPPLSLAHQADLLRLAVLAAEGGIYLDADVYALRSFADLRANRKDVVLGHEGGNRYGLGNAVIVSRPASSFLTRWRGEYDASFDPRVWNYHSILLPKRLAIQYPAEICALSPTAFFWPTWHRDHIRYMHEPIAGPDVAELRANMSQHAGAMYPNQLAYHAWGHVVRERYLAPLTTDDVRTKDTRFNILIRDIVNAKI